MGMFAKEIAVYEQNLGGWLRAGHAGSWVIIKGEEVTGPLPSERDTYAKAVEMYGSGFLFRQVREQQPVVALLPLIVSAKPQPQP